MWTVDQGIGLRCFPPCAVLILWPSTYKHCSANKYLKLSDEKEMYKDRKLYHSSATVCTVRYFSYVLYIFPDFWQYEILIIQRREKREKNMLIRHTNAPIDTESKNVLQSMSCTLSISATLCLCKIRQKASSHPRDIYFMTKRTHNFICRGNQAHIKTSQCISIAVASPTVFFGLIWAWIETVTSSLHSCWQKCVIRISFTSDDDVNSWYLVF